MLSHNLCTRSPLTAKSEHAIRPTLHVRHHTPSSACSPVPPHHPFLRGVVAHRRRLAHHRRAARSRSTRPGSVDPQRAGHMFRALRRDLSEQSAVLLIES